MDCLNEEQLESLLQTDAKNTTAKARHEHVARCKRCQVRFQEIKANEHIYGEIHNDFPNGISRSTKNVHPLRHPEMAGPFLTATKKDTARLDIPSGYVLNDHYEVVEEVGRGNAVVYLAKFKHHDIALKVIPADTPEDTDAFDLLVQEWDRQKRIMSEHVVDVNIPQQAQYEGMPLFILPMDYAPGGSLRRWINEHYELQEERITIGTELFLHTCKGVKAIHKAGQVHLDLKPENILLFKSDTELIAKVSDFGIARSLQHTPGRTSLPFSGCGTPEYMSPEQFSFLRQCPVGIQSDIYSLGVILFELVTGDRPFNGKPLELKNLHLKKRQPRLKGELSRWDQIIDRCMRKDPDDRYRSVEDLIHEVIHVQRELSLTVDIVCPNCDHINVDVTRTDCEKCDGSLPDSFFQMCIRCNGKVRLDREDCPRCGKIGVAAYYLLRQRMARAEKLKDEDPAEAIELLELVLREGVKGDTEKRATEIIVDMRKKHEQIIPLCSEAAQAVAEGDLEGAIRAWQGVLTIVPRHRQALRNKKILKEQLSALVEGRDKAQFLIEEARFDKAENLLMSYLEKTPTRRDVREVLERCHKLNRQYSEQFAQAEEAYRSKMISQAKTCVLNALRCAPRSQEAMSMAKDIEKIERLTEELIRNAYHQLASGTFGEVYNAISELEQLWVNCPGLVKLQEDILEIEPKYESAMKKATEAITIRDLISAKQKLSQALEVCPQSSDARLLTDQVKRDERHATEILDKVPSLIQAAQFEQAGALIHDSEKLWRSHRKLKLTQKNLSETQIQFDRLMDRSRKAFDTHEFNMAGKALRQAIKVCPEAANPQTLLAQIEQHKRRANEILESVLPAIRTSKLERAESLILDSEKIWPSNPELTNTWKLLSKIRTRYCELLDDAQNAIEAGDLNGAQHLITQALDVCPESHEAKNRLQQVESEKVRASRLLQGVEPMIAATCFDSASRKLEKASNIWRSVPGLEKIHNSLMNTRHRYSKSFGSAKEALSRGHLEQSLGDAEKAVSVCPSSEEAQELIHTVKRIRARAWDCLQEAKTLLLEAKFEAAKVKAAESRKRWSDHIESKQVAAQINALEGDYAAQIKEAHESLAKEELEKALSACSLALYYCPQSANAKTLENQIKDLLDKRQRQIESRWSFKVKLIFMKTGRRLIHLSKKIVHTMFSLILVLGGILAVVLFPFIVIGIFVFLMLSNEGVAVVLVLFLVLLAMYLIMGEYKKFW